jgi:hypothetical protein
VDSSKFASKGKNTPFDGCKFKGKVMATIVAGEVVYMDDSLKSHCHSPSGHCSPPSVIASEAKQTGSLKIRRIFRGKSHG